MRAALLAAVGVLALAAPAWAGPSIPPSVCHLTDLSLTIGAASYNPTSCVADVEIGQAPADPATETGLLDAAFSNTFQFLAKADSGGNSTGLPLHGIQFTLAASTFNASSGTWTITWTDTNGPAANNLPEVIDFDVLINGGSNGSGYQFTGVTLPVSPNSGTGNFQITFFNNGGQNPALSHMIITGGDDVPVPPPPPPPPPPPVPEPASLALLGMGLAALGIVRKRRT